MSGKVVQLTEKPGTLDIYARAVRSALPVVGASGDSAPDTTLVLSGVRVDPDNLAAYDRVTGLRFGDTLPLTYPFTLVFPVVMKLMVSEGFPFPAIGSVHAENVIEQFRPISVIEPLDVSVHAENLREHRKGLLIDVVSEIKVGRELVWRQTSTFLRQQKTSLSGQPGPEPKAEEEPARPLRTMRVDQKTISRYAAVSGDRNPIHVSSLGAKAFGFPKTIAHGMWSAAAVLGTVEGRIPDAVTYSVRFGKPILLPSTLNVYADQTADGWDLSIKHPKKGYPHLTATLR
ncbi:MULTISPECIES: MaoC/PaaZ C-terminal domain-containing protein [unclassified Rhodococcus (in: high G+C Gram-positive bacteria)]|uniref:MaoC/PaaZ C-terminal domain-containing protein n=1 Tax=unclassified Rhodococcus (in: high G+C Gram-positive bacteria) TaxID=192944 RepID=UPI00163A3764|nr:MULTISPECIES: MaoC/PaaZ C-terminal domain-containing protein [unclassified Rhodococcus (in: high G+C Gram-positive bacteria)]MBC2642537.1 dehydratase [Rhodococcus sp. 3A]MBC2892721.1 dehydratase [Rhodococcus sp. 4CII]